MATQNTVSTLDGFFKATYGDQHINAVPDFALLLKMIKFKETQQIGKSYQVPVILSSEHGATYLAAGDGVTTLNDSIAAVSKNCEVPGSQLILRGQMDYEAAAKAQSSKTAFMNVSELLVQNLIDSASRRLELMFLYGGVGMGVGDSSVNTDATHTVVTMTVASWSAGIWSGMEGAKIQFYKQSDGTLVSSGADSKFAIDSVDVDNRKLTLSGTATGIAALDTALGAGDCDIYFDGAKAKEANGLVKIAQNTGSLFGISATDYSLWKANSHSAASGPLTMAKVLSAVGKAVARGLNEEVVVLVNPVTWQNLNSDQAALRRYNGESKKADVGFEAIEFYGMNGKISIVGHPMIKQGHALVFPPKRVKRVGATDLSFKTPGRNDEIFLHRQDQNAYELRIYGNQSIFCEKPACMVEITAIVNS